MDRIPRKDKEFTAETRRNAEKTLKEIKSSKTQKVLKTLDCEGHKDLLLISSLRSEMAKDDALLAKFSAKKSLSSQRSSCLCGLSGPSFCCGFAAVKSPRLCVMGKPLDKKCA